MYLTTYISLLLLSIILVAVILAICMRRDATEHFINKPITISENVLNIDKEDVATNEHIIVDGKNLANIVDNIKKTNRLNKDTVRVGIEDSAIYGAIRSDYNLQLLFDPYVNYYVL